jgi:hypothetical protein
MSPPGFCSMRQGRLARRRLPVPRSSLCLSEKVVERKLSRTVLTTQGKLSSWSQCYWDAFRERNDFRFLKAILPRRSHERRCTVYLEVKPETLPHDKLYNVNKEEFHLVSDNRCGSKCLEYAFEEEVLSKRATRASQIVICTPKDGACCRACS